MHVSAVKDKTLIVSWHKLKKFKQIKYSLINLAVKQLIVQDSMNYYNLFVSGTYNTL